MVSGGCLLLRGRDHVLYIFYYIFVSKQLGCCQVPIQVGDQRLKEWSIYFDDAPRVVHCFYAARVLVYIHAYLKYRIAYIIIIYHKQQ